MSKVYPGGQFSNGLPRFNQANRDFVEAGNQIPGDDMNAELLPLELKHTVWACPKCKSTGLEVVVRAWAVLTQLADNIETDVTTAEDQSEDWDENSRMHCCECGHDGLAKEFATEVSLDRS